MKTAIPNISRQLGTLLVLCTLLVGVTVSASLGATSACIDECPCCGPACDGWMCGMHPRVAIPGEPHLEAPKRPCIQEGAGGAGALSFSDGASLVVSIPRSFTKPLPERPPTLSSRPHSPRQPRAPPSRIA